MLSARGLECCAACCPARIASPPPSEAVSIEMIPGGEAMPGEARALEGCLKVDPRPGIQGAFC